MVAAILLQLCLSFGYAQARDMLSKQSSVLRSKTELAGPFALNLPDGSSVKVPTISAEDPSIYKAAVENAFVGLPAPCMKTLGLEANFGDKDGEHIHKDGQNTTWFGRIAELSNGSLEKCTCSWVIVNHGSGGLTYINYRYIARLTALGYAAFAPDSMSQPPQLKLRHKNGAAPLMKVVRDSGASESYWSQEIVYTSGCPWASETPFCYSSNPDWIIQDPDGFREYYERVFKLRKAELDYLVENMAAYKFLISGRDGKRLFMLGQSEGAMVTARYYHPKLEPMLSGRVISAWSCEANYYVMDESEAATIGGGRANKSTPVLNLIGTADHFFGSTNSVASLVSAGLQNNGMIGGLPAPTGNCFSSLKAAGNRGAVAVMQGAAHDSSYTHDNFGRDVMSEFLNDPMSIAEGSRTLKLFCHKSPKSTKTLTLWERCEEDGGEPLKKTPWGEDAHIEYHFPPVEYPQALEYAETQTYLSQPESPPLWPMVIVLVPLVMLNLLAWRWYHGRRHQKVSQHQIMLIDP
eukprot:gnl/MRDRNA2_/MRDRNA2_135006_c0_seq1.p1 gnl/MRDRNA2_/MRDRNA2_135006_c0~~gnl/MRDRNA2_/MRDRNA2_135006_c0_seq1.p1  ORF type:complete len:521 (-),score=95.47 gnl/MRDRNA2_/MRDRNA2_135006_c0_seq1:135-1697(-)